MEIIVSIFCGLVGFVISNYIGNLLVTWIITRILPIKQGNDGRFTIVNGTNNDIKIYGLFQNIAHHATAMSNMALVYIFVTVLRGPISLLLGPALARIFVTVILLYIAKYSRSAFTRLINYKKA